jgi:hypothetical protein
MRKVPRVGFAAFLWVFIAIQGHPAGSRWGIAFTPAQKEALAAISPDSLRGHLSFLASDLLQGRPTPSPGQDVAAEYIAAQFRRAGLKPGGDREYFQTVLDTAVAPDPVSFQCRLMTGAGEIPVSRQSFSMMRWENVQLKDVPLFKLGHEASVPSGAAGRIIALEVPRSGSLREISQRRLQLFQKLAKLNPAMIVEVARNGEESRFLSGGSRRLADDHSDEDRMPSVPYATINDPAFVAAWDALPAGLTASTLSAHVVLVETKLDLHNVIGLLPGSDPTLAQTYVILSAHYDGTGPRPGADPAQVWNAANDDGSGTVSVIELASVFSAMREKPRRSLVFIAFFGEEGGLIGSRHYARHPSFALEKTVAMINLEQVGRTDSTEGDQRRRASLTGFDFSDLGDVFRRAGELTGVTVYKDLNNSDRYFSGSDNLSLAEAGVPAHTICVAFEFPDYHGEGDDWPKIDYENMAQTVRTIGAAALIVAQSDETPRWNPASGKAGKYLEAWQKLHPESR